MRQDVAKRAKNKKSQDVSIRLKRYCYISTKRAIFNKLFCHSKMLQQISQNEITLVLGKSLQNVFTHINTPIK